MLLSYLFLKRAAAMLDPCASPLPTLENVQAQLLCARAAIEWPSETPGVMHANGVRMAIELGMHMDPRASMFQQAGVWFVQVAL